MHQESTYFARSRAAIDKLERAVMRLEGALGRPKGDLFVNDALRAAQDDYVRLEGTAQMVETRLDAVIDRLKTILEE